MFYVIQFVIAAHLADFLKQECIQNSVPSRKTQRRRRPSPGKTVSLVSEAAVVHGGARYTSPSMNIQGILIFILHDCFLLMICQQGIFDITLLISSNDLSKRYIKLLLPALFLLMTCQQGHASA